MLRVNSAASRQLLLPCLCTRIFARPHLFIEQSAAKPNLYDQTEERVSFIEE